MYKILGAIAIVTLLVSGCSTTPKVMEKRVFTNPTTQDGYPVDRCYTWATDCDKPVADRICRAYGYDHSIRSSWEHKNLTQLLTGRMCKGSGCGAITSVECIREKTSH